MIQSRWEPIYVVCDLVVHLMVICKATTVRCPTAEDARTSLLGCPSLLRTRTRSFSGFISLLTLENDLLDSIWPPYQTSSVATAAPRSPASPPSTPNHKLPSLSPLMAQSPKPKASSSLDCPMTSAFLSTATYSPLLHRSTLSNGRILRSTTQRARSRT